MSSYRVISSDSHIVEPPDLWATRLEPEYSDRGPRVARDEAGDWWVCDDEKLVMASIPGTLAGKRFAGDLTITESEMFGLGRPGGYIPEEHVKDMDADGVHWGVIYPSTGLALFRFSPGTEFLNAIFGAYNDWIAEFCNTYPDRLKGIAMINVEDVQGGVKELERCANMGLAGAMITTYPEGLRYFEGRGYDSPAYEALWAAAQDLDMPISLHITTNRPAQGDKVSEMNVHLGQPSLFVNIDHWVRMSLTHMIFSGVFER